MSNFINKTKEKQILCFGGGSYFRIMCCDMSNIYPNIKIVGVLDNDVSKSNQTITAAGISTKIITIENALNKFDFAKTAIVITTAQLNVIKEQLTNIVEFENVDVYSYFDLKRNSVVLTEELCKNTDEPLIPKVIHYCWFGGNELPEELQKCIDSWKKFCFGWEIKQWNESNYDIYKNVFTQKAYELKKWAFISDYARFDIIYNNGGIYFDTDVELLKNPEILRYNRGFIGTELIGGINSGSGLGAVKQHHILKKFMEMYENNPNFSKSFFSTNIGRETDFFYSIGYRLNGKIQIIDGMAILPYYILTHKTFETGEIFANDKTVSVHHLDGSWR